jgi:hypothetical protein
MSAPAKVEQKVERVAQHYGRPASELEGFAGIMAAYTALMGAAAWILGRRGALPGRIEAGDLALAAVATHKLSRTISRDAVTSPLRAPFARFEEEGAPGEVNEEVRKSGAGHALGELLSCPFCLDQWVASGFVTGFAVAPRLTRFVASVFAVRSGADLLQYAYSAIDQAVE